MKQSIKDIDKKDRPREKTIKYGIEYLSNEELLALVLRCGTKNYNVLQLSSIIMKKYNNFIKMVLLIHLPFIYGK